jgi:hypothetical protein
MRKIWLKKSRFVSLILFAAILAQTSCKKNSIEMSDLLGTWLFQNSLIPAYNEIVGAQVTVTLNADLSLTLPDPNDRNGLGFAFSAALFRMVIRYPIFPTRIIHYILWEGEMPAAGTLSGKIYSSRPPTNKSIMHYEKQDEIGRFTARLISD